MKFPTCPVVAPIWDDSNESVKSWGGRTWRVRDLRKVVEDQEVFDLPLSLIPLNDHRFEADDLYEFAQHMLHVRNSDLSIPIIMCERGRVIDGRHRIVKALLEGRDTIRCVKIPEGQLSTTTS